MMPEKPLMCECGHPLMYHTVLYPPSAPGSCIKSKLGQQWLWGSDPSQVECDCRGLRYDDTKPWAVNDDHVRVRLAR